MTIWLHHSISCFHDTQGILTVASLLVGSVVESLDCLIHFTLHSTSLLVLCFLVLESANKHILTIPFFLTLSHILYFHNEYRFCDASAKWIGGEGSSNSSKLDVCLVQVACSADQLHWWGWWYLDEDDAQSSWYSNIPRELLWSRTISSKG